MLKGKLESIFFKLNKNEEGFLLVVFNTSEGLFELDNCILKKIDFLTEGYQIYDSNNYNPDDLHFVYIVSVLLNEEMDFIVVLDNYKVIIIGADSNFNNHFFNQIIQVFDFKSLSEDYVNSAENYYLNDPDM
jgi:hypothetical protein